MCFCEVVSCYCVRSFVNASAYCVGSSISSLQRSLKPCSGVVLLLRDFVSRPFPFPGFIRAVPFFSLLMRGVLSVKKTGAEVFSDASDTLCVVTVTNVSLHGITVKRSN